MPKFLPPKKIADFQQYNYVPFEKVPQSYFTEIAQNVEKLKSDDPLISVVLIAYNEENFILGTLASLSKTISKHKLELIVVNNNSSDNTQKFIEACNFKSVFETKQGYAHARQAGLNIAKGKYVVTGDTDTIYQPFWIDEMVKPLLQKKAVCTYSLHAFYTDDKKYPPSLLLYQRAKYLNVLLKDRSRPHLNCGGASMAYLKETALQVGGYDTEVGRGEDGTLAFEMGKIGKIQLVSSGKALIYTNMRRTQMDGNLMAAFVKRVLYHARYAGLYLFKQKER